MSLSLLWLKLYSPDFNIHLTGTRTSKEPLSADVSDSVSWDIPWDDNMGDELLKVLIDKAKLFEAQIWYVIKASLNSLAS